MTVDDLDRIFKAYDVRGVVPDDLNEDLARRIGAAFAEFSGGPKVVIGRDCRLSSPDIAAALSAGITSRGVGVVDLGLASTDLLYFASGSLDLPAVMITASHNPKQYNGLKFCLSGARPVGVESGLLEIRAMTETGLAPTGEPGLVEHRDLLPAYTEHVLTFLDASTMRPLTVAIDTANGMGGLVAPAVLERLPVTLHHLFPELDGTFPNHPADPIDPENQRDLRAAVLRHEADIGLAFDGDADRVFLIDEKGQDVSGSIVTALVAKAMLAREPGASIIYNLICSWTVQEVIVENGGVPVRTRVGHSFIKQVMAETGAIFGGEHSGHYYFRENYRRRLRPDRRRRGDGAAVAGGRSALRAARAVPPVRGLGRDQHAGEGSPRDDRACRRRAERGQAGPPRRADGRVRGLVVQRAAVQHGAAAAAERRGQDRRAPSGEDGDGPRADPRRRRIVTVDAELLEILVCPNDRGELDYLEDQQVIVCRTCGYRYPVRDDIPVMLIDEAEKPAEKRGGKR